MLRFLLFAKRPRPGRVKTRLASRLGPRSALQIYRAFLGDQLALLATFAVECETELCLDGTWDTGIDGPIDVPPARMTLQGEGDLGQRMLRALRRCRQDGAEATLILGVDAPDLPRDRVRQALDRLTAGSAAIVAPATDGGYVMIGMRRPIDALFRDIPWGGPDVLQVSHDRAAEIGLRLEELDDWPDVDDLVDLVRLRHALEEGPAGRRAPRTRAILATLDWPSLGVV